MSVNKFIGIGRIGKDPETRVVSNDFKVANFSIAISEKYTNKAGEKVENTEWINCQATNKLAEIVEKYVKKGDQIYIEGKFKTRSWEKDGVKLYATYIQVESLQMLGSKPTNQTSDEPAKYETGLRNSLPPTEYATQGQVDDESLPF